jgi:hypothetical protein
MNTLAGMLLSLSGVLNQGFRLFCCCCEKVTVAALVLAPLTLVGSGGQLPV